MTSKAASSCTMWWPNLRLRSRQEWQALHSEAPTEYAEIDSEVVLIGLYERIELWSPLTGKPTCHASKSGMR